MAAVGYLVHLKIEQTVTNSGVLTSNWIRGIHRYRVARHNMPVMFFNGLNFPMNFRNPGLTNTTVMHTANTHAQLIPICRDRRHVVLIQSCVMKLAGAGAGAYHMYNVSVCWRGRGWVTGGAVAIIWSDLIENMRVISALQIKLLNSQCHLSALFFCFFILQKQSKDEKWWVWRTKVKEWKERDKQYPHIKVDTCENTVTVWEFSLKSSISMMKHKHARKTGAKPILHLPLCSQQQKCIAAI